MRFKVQSAAKEDVFQDIVRISERHRLDTKERVIVEGAVCRVTIGGRRSALVSVRGAARSEDAVVLVDEVTRARLGVCVGEEYDLRLRPVWWLGQFLWAWSASDPAYRIAARLGLLSVVLGVLGLLVALIPWATHLAKCVGAASITSR